MSLNVKGRAKKMKKRQVGLMVFGFLFFVLFSFGLSWAQNPPTMLIVVRGMDDSLWKMTCDEVNCSAFSSFPGMFAYQPTVTWDEKTQEWVVVGTAAGGSIWMGTFDKQGNFNNDWQPLPGLTPSPAGASGAYYGILGQLNCTSGQVAKWNGSAWACEDDLSGVGTPSSTVANLDGTSLAGTSDNYSPGDHKHGFTPGSISNVMIADGAVSGAKIGDGQVTNPKITGPIDGSKISSTGLNADTVDGLHASAFASASHPHSGADITSGIISEARIDPLIARDSEVTTAVNAHASRTDNPHATTAAQVGAALVVHNHDGTYALIVHNHDATYVNATGDTMTGTLNVPGLIAPQISTNSPGTNLSISAADGTGNGGDINITAGQAGSASGGGGGDINITAGYNKPAGGAGYSNLGPAGVVTITGAGGYNSAGGNVTIQSGMTSDWASPSNAFSKVSILGGTVDLVVNTGGSIEVEGGHNASTGAPYAAIGGNVLINGGNANNGAYSGGSIILTGGNGLSGASGGGVILMTNGTKPGCSSTNRGMLWYTQGGSNVTDLLEVCAKDATNAYAWRALW